MSALSESEADEGRRADEGPGGSGGLQGKGTGRPQRYRDRMWSAAASRNVPLSTILTTLVLAVVILDVNALAILLLWVLRTVLLYCVVALFIALLLSPAVHGLERLHLGRGAAVTVVFVVAVVVFLGIVALFTAPLVHAVTKFAKDLPSLVKQAEHGRGRVGALIQRFHLQKWVSQNAPKIAGDITRSLKPAQALSVGAAALSTVVALGAIAILSLFLLLEAPGLRRAILGLMSPARAARVARIYDEASRSVTGYMLGNALTSLVAGVVVFITLVLVGVPYALLLGLWVALVDLLPMVGGLIAGVPVAIIAFFHSVPAFVIVVVVFLVYQQIENHILNPLVMSRTVRMNPLWVLLAVLVGATLGARVGSGLGAFVGALVGIPVGGAIQVVVREARAGGPVPGPESAPGSQHSVP